MLYAQLIKFIGSVRDGYTSRLMFSCGIRYWRSFADEDGLYSINISYQNDKRFCIMCRDNSEKWREKLDCHSSSAEYDLIVTQSTPQTQAVAP